MSADEGRVAEPPAEFDIYQLVLLWRPRKRAELEPAEEERLQSLHLGHLAAMKAAGFMKVAGPLSHQPDERLRGVCIYQADSLDEARNLAESDPAVRAGALEVSLMLWHVPRGSFDFEA